MESDSEWLIESQLKQRVSAIKYNLTVCSCEENDRFCMIVLPSVNGEFDRYSDSDSEMMPEEWYATFFYGIVSKLMKERDADLYEKYDNSLASGKSGYYPTDEEYAAFSALYNECVDIAVKDERWIEICEDYDGAYSRNLEVKKERFGKVDWTADEKFFLDLGF